MLNAICQGCGTTVYVAVKRDGKANPQMYSERVLYRLVTHNGGPATAVPVHGLYEVHKCATNSKGYTYAREKMNRKGQTGLIPAKVVRQRRRHKVPMSSGR